jgi:hypothetical protein
VNSGRETDRWRVLAPIELNSRNASQAVCRVLDTADCLRAEVTLASAVRPWPFGSWRNTSWPREAIGETKPHLDVRRIVLAGSPAEAIARCADRAAVNAIVLPPEYCSRRHFLRRSVALQLAGLTTRPMLTLPGYISAGPGISLRRIACLGRGDASDEPILRFTKSVAARCGGDVLTVSNQDAAAEPDAGLRNGARSLVRVVEQLSVGLLIAARPVYLSTEASGPDLLALAGHLPCHVLSVPLISALP